MSNELQLFTHPKFGNVRGFMQDGKPYFVASDVATALGYTNPMKTIRDHCKHAKLLKHNEMLCLGFDCGPRGMFVIPEGDLYRLIVSSKLPTAEKFERWVFDEVLPTLHEKGYYATKQLTMEDLCREYLATCEKQRQLEADISKVSAEKQLAITQRDEIGNSFGAGPEYYKVSEIPWLYAIFKRGYEKYLHKRIGQMLAGICKAQGTRPKKCQHDNGGHWWRAYPKQVIEMLHQQLLADPHLLQNLRISKRKSVPQNKCRCLNFR